VAEIWQVKTKDDGLFEYDGYARAIGGSLCIFMEQEGKTMLWGPGSWVWAHNGVTDVKWEKTDE
jgi:hypothetical protein